MTSVLPRTLDDREVQQLNDLDAASAEEMDLLPASRYDAATGELELPNKSYQVGEKAFDESWMEGGKKAVFEGTVTGTTNEPIVIFDRTGQAFTMPMDLAKMRLRKRWPMNHAVWPGERVFFTRPPVARTLATLECPLANHPITPCKKRLYTADQVDDHFRSKHKDHAGRADRAKTEAREERLVALQEAQVKQGEAMTAILERLAGGQTVTQEEAAAALGTTAAPVLMPNGNVEDWTVAQMRTLMQQLGRSPKGAATLTSEQWRAHTRAVIEELGL